MKNFIFILAAMLIFSCKDQERTSTTSKVTGQDTVSSEIPAPGNIQEERDGVQTEREKPRIVATLDGKYRKVEENQESLDCNCNCIEIDFNTVSEWCIDKDKLYINARTEQTGENTAAVYFVSAAREINPDRELPWEDFDTDAPVATINFTPDGGAELDWLGFSSNGEVLTDYALYGKKTLEGTYKKE